MEHTGGLLEALRGAVYARELEVMGPVPRRRAGTAIWGPRIPIVSIEGGRVTLANGSSGPAKAFRPAPREPEQLPPGSADTAAPRERAAAGGADGDVSAAPAERAAATPLRRFLDASRAASLGEAAAPAAPAGERPAVTPFMRFLEASRAASWDRAQPR